MSNNSGNVLLAALIGAAVGVGVGVLIAPDSGANTRKKLKDRMHASKEEWLEKWKSLTERAGGKTEDVLAGLSDLLDEWTADGKKDSDEMITLLEQKLKHLKQSSKNA